MCEALKDAFVNKHCPYCCLLCATQLQTVREPWWAATGAVKEVPLFGEYTSSDLSDKYVWAGNECRLETLGLLYEATVREDHPFTATTIPRDTDAASERLDTTVAAVLCGNWELLNRQKTFSSSWTDTVWSYLRCSLVVAFTHYLRCCQVPVPEAYADYVARKVQETPQRWEEHYAQEVWKGLTALLEPFLTTTSLVEQLQIRSLLQVLQPSQKWLNVRPRERDATGEETRLITLVLLLFNQAGRDELCGKAAMCTTPGDLNYCVTRYTYKLAELHRHDVFEGMRLAIVMAKQLHDHTGRAQAYATYIVCVRQYEYVRQVMNREAVESQEGRLVRLFLEADPDRRAVGRQVQGLLSDTVPTDTLLTRNPLAERILWEAMHAQTLEDHAAVLRHGVDACVQFWLDPQGPLLEAIHDVSGILYREVLLRYTGPRKIDQVLNYPTLPADRIGEAEFWHTFSKCCRLSVSHITAATEMSALRAHAAGSLYDSDRAKVYELSQTEHSLLEGLTQHVGEALLNARAVVHRHAGCAGVIVHLLTIYLESAVMALQARPLEDEGDLGVLQCAASCVNCTHKEEIYFQNKPFEEDRKDQHYRRPHGEEEVLYRSTARRVDPIALQPVMRLFAQLHLACLERQHRREVQGILIERERN
ncbi:hypothetical protein AGDE_11354 [Angomonas deanei]|nr:hypothetical protein AGDE_11354 [Angomonas deanei]|eukprot:EPY26408.1 hypothetical protein AGDE_11354 [Angomonas deanei]